MCFDLDMLIILLQNIMAYEVIILYHLHMPFLLSFFCIFYYTLDRSSAASDVYKRQLSSSYAIFIVIFLYILLYFYRARHKISEEVCWPLLILSVNLYHAAFTVLFLILSSISMAFSVCIPKKIRRISRFLFLAFILASE